MFEANSPGPPPPVAFSAGAHISLLSDFAAQECGRCLWTEKQLGNNADKGTVALSLSSRLLAAHHRHQVDKDAYAADYIELTFQDQYLGRNDMWRLSAYLAGQCVFVEQEHSFIGVIAVKVQNIYLNGKKVDAVRLSHPLRP